MHLEQLDTGAQLFAAPDGTVLALEYESEDLLAYDKTGRFLGAKLLQPGERRTEIGSQATWGAGFNPVPVLLKDGAAICFLPT